MQRLNTYLTIFGKPRYLGFANINEESGFDLERPKWAVIRTSRGYEMGLPGGLITPELESWSEYAVKEGNIDLAEKIEKLRIISTRKNLSAPMLSDLIIMTLMEGNTDIEYILDDIR